MTDKIKRSLDFVVRFYRPNLFRPDGWFIAPPLPFWRRHAVAVAVIGVALAAAAAITTYVALRPQTPEKIEMETSTPEVVEPDPVLTEEAPVIEEAPAVKKIEFDNASLSEVVNAIEETYGVKVAGSTGNQPPLTLSYEGNAEDLVSTINDLLGTNLRIEK